MSTRLTDIVGVMKSKWTYGDSYFGYTEELNDNHNTKYPSMLITPPDSVFPEFRSNNGWEELSFTVFFSDLYQRTHQSNESIEQRWDNLQDLANEWLDLFLRFYQDNQLLAWLDDESISIERRKEVANDQLLQIRMNFSLKINSRCFMPVSQYPSDFTQLVVWLKADSGLTYSTPTKKITNWADQSGNSNSVKQLTKNNQPLRFTYDGALDKTRINFNGTTQHFISANLAPITGNDFTIFIVSKYTDLTNTEMKLFSIKESGTDRLQFSYANNGKLSLKVIDDDGHAGTVLSDTNSTSFTIASCRMKKRIGSNGSDIFVQLNNDTEVTTHVTDFNNNDTGFDDAHFFIGYADEGSENAYLKGDICEVIVYNNALESNEREEVKNYLNRKFKIY